VKNFLRTYGPLVSTTLSGIFLGWGVLYTLEHLTDWFWLLGLLIVALNAWNLRTDFKAWKRWNYGSMAQHKLELHEQGVKVFETYTP